MKRKYDDMAMEETLNAIKGCIKEDSDDIVHVYCDGGYRSKHNLGGWAGILVWNKYNKVICGTEENTTNNRMEQTAAIKCLEMITDKSVPTVLVSDSQYLVNAMNVWMEKWIKNKWITQDGNVKNRDLWEKLYDLKKQFKMIKFVWCRGHSNNALNNEVDELVNKAMDEHGRNK